jgi:hypothetical protein
MLKYVAKFASDILPSVAATIIGAYIVNHYIVNKPGAAAPPAAAVSPADPKTADVKNAKPSETSSNIPEAGVRAKGISEKAILEKSLAERPAEKPPEKSADKPAETASIPVETRRHQPAPREKTSAKTINPAPVQSPAVTVAVAPVVSAPGAVPPVETAIVPEEHRDANDLARAAIERLRGANEGSPRPQETARAPEAARIPERPRVASVPPMAAPPTAAPPVRPLPPPIMVSTPAAEIFDPSTQMQPPYPAARRVDDPGRPTPPADIPQVSSEPLNLGAAAVDPPRRPHTTVADDVLLAAKSMFHAVVPNSSE